jgi:pimeloyl-ACP methyl ester carboxylesterase
MATQFSKGGQVGWYYDLGHTGGFFHTYDLFKVAGSQDAPRTVHVFLPRDYENSPERFPVIYMNDGDTAFFPGGAVKKSWNMAEVLSQLYAKNQLRQVMVVAVYPLNRDREYTHAPVRDHDCCGLDRYSDYIANAVKGFFDANYRTLPDAQHTMVLGSSHGGLAAFYTATKYPDQFRKVGALSASFWVGLDSNPSISELPFLRSLESSTLLDLARPTLQNPDKRLKIYMDWGLVRNGGRHNSLIENMTTMRGREMRDLLMDKFGYHMNENLFVVEDPNGEHSEESWSRRVPNALQKIWNTV